MATHTAGPWHVGPVDDTAVTASDGTEICHASGDYDDDAVWPVMEANARLIAAAPDLLAAAIAANYSGAKTENGKASISREAFDALADAIWKATAV